MSWPYVRGALLISFKPSSANQALTGQSISWRALLMKPRRSRGSACCSSVGWSNGWLAGCSCPRGGVKSERQQAEAGSSNSIHLPLPSPLPFPSIRLLPTDCCGQLTVSLVGLHGRKGEGQDCLHCIAMLCRILAGILCVCKCG